VRGILLKGATLPTVLPELGAIALFLATISAITLYRFRRTLD
jgi:hypothetical protein